MNNVTMDVEEVPECVEEGDRLMRFVMHGVLLNGIGAGGLLGNALAVLVLSRPQMRSSINCLLVGLAACDTALILTSVLLFGLPAIYPYTGRLRYYHFYIFPHLVPYVYPLSGVAQTMSVYLTLIVTVERWVAVCQPFRAITLCTWSHALWCVLGVALFAFLYNMPKFFELQAYHRESAGDIIYCLGPTSFRSETYVEVYLHWLYLVVMYIVPFSALAALNTCIVRQVRRAQAERAKLSVMQRQELKVTTMLLVVVLIFFICNILLLVIHACEAFLERGLQDLVFVVHLSTLLVVFYSSVNFVIYMIFGKKFRSVFLKTVYSRRGKARSCKGRRGSRSPPAGDCSDTQEDTVTSSSSTATVQYPELTSVTTPATAPTTVPNPASDQEHYI